MNFIYKFKRASLCFIKIYLCILYFVLHTTPSIATDAVNNESSVNLYGLKLPDRFREDGSAPYNKLINYIESQTGVIFNITLLPPKRTKFSFENDKKSCIFPSPLNAIERGFYKIGNEPKHYTPPVDTIDIRVFTRFKDDTISTTDDLINKLKKVGYVRGTVGPKDLSINQDIFLPLNSEEQMIPMLLLGRLDAFVGHQTDTLLALERLGNAGEVKFDPSLALTSFSVVLYCRDFKGVQGLIEPISQIILRLRHTGALKNILSPYATIPDLTPEEYMSLKLSN